MTNAGSTSKLTTNKETTIVALDPAQMTIAEASAAIESGSLKPSALIESCLQQATVTEPEVRAWAHSGGDYSRMAARLLDSQRSTGSLHGIPFGVKDIIAVSYTHLTLPTICSV